ncbi:hypothetical protein AAHA92_01487 [Salvia divinorum]|uniref:Uncharacterized protein n=1 Tax=Salvia divinorum TaxID=28513 RepID=A0ABD1IBM3_SALDI
MEFYFPFGELDKQDHNYGDGNGAKSTSIYIVIVSLLKLLRSVGIVIEKLSSNSGTDKPLAVSGLSSDVKKRGCNEVQRPTTSFGTGLHLKNSLGSCKQALAPAPPSPAWDRTEPCCRVPFPVNDEDCLIGKNGVVLSILSPAICF